MSDGSFPHKQPQPDVPEPPPKEERVGARVLDFPTEEVTGNSIVPAGTWADDAADGAPDASTDRLLRPAGGDAPGGEVVEFPRSASTAKRRRVQAPDVSGTQPTQLPRKRDDEETVQRPRFLASELLRQEWWPRTPLERTNRWGAVAVGAGGWSSVVVRGAPPRPLLLRYRLRLGGAASAVKAHLWRGPAALVPWLRHGAGGTLLLLVTARAWEELAEDEAAPQAVRLTGRAWSGNGVPVEKVEVGIDGKWYPTQIRRHESRYAWSQWNFEWEAEPGEHLLSCCATDAEGNMQPDAPVWDQSGFGNNSIHTLQVTVGNPKSEIANA